MIKESECTIVKLEYKVPKDKFEQFAECLALINTLLEAEKPVKVISSNAVLADSNCSQTAFEHNKSIFNLSQCQWCYSDKCR